MAVIIIQLLSEDASVGSLQSDGTASVSIAFNQSHRLQLESDGNTSVQAGLTGLNRFLKELVSVGGAFGVVSLSVAQALGNLQSNGAGTGVVSLRLNNDPNRFLELSASGVGTAALVGVFEQTIVLISNGSSSPGLILNQSFSETAELNIFLDVLPVFSNARIQHVAARLLVNETGVPISRFRYSAPANSLGASFECNLSKTDLSQFDFDDDFRFQIGTKSTGTGATTWTTVLEGKFSSRNYSISFENDLLQLETVSALTDKLETSPRSNLTVYDSDKTQIEFNESDVLQDNLGNFYFNSKQDVRGLRIHALFEIAFVNGCGFSAVRTNIPNFSVTRADFSISQTYKQAVDGHIGAFEPLFFESDGELWILDSTAGLPSNFLPRSLKASRFKNFSQTSSSQILDGLIVRFTESTGAETFFVVETETDESQSGEGDGYQKTQSVRTIHSYRRSDSPDTVIKRVVVKEVVSTFNHQNTLIAETTTTFNFDPLGNLLKQRSLKRALIPELSAPYEVTLETIRDETQTINYLWNGRSPTIYQKQTVITGLIAIDEDNTYLDEPFKQEFGEAHKAGNLADGMTTEFGSIKTIVETFRPTGNGQTKVFTQTIDFLRKTVLRSENEVFSGEANQPVQRSRSMLVWRDGIDLDDLTGKKIDDFAVGEIGVRFAVPLAKRKLKKLALRKGNANVSFAGVDLSVRRGSLFRIIGRDGTTSYGDFLTLGFEIVGENLGLRNASLETVLQMFEV